MLTSFEGHKTILGHRFCQILFVYSLKGKGFHQHGYVCHVSDLSCNFTVRFFDETFHVYVGVLRLGFQTIHSF